VTSTTQDVPALQAEGFFSLALLDAAQGHAIKTWKFDHTNVVSIGRLEDNDVVLTDPIVSRLHATIKNIDDRWELIALGKHGVLVNDRRVETIDLNHDDIFQLGPNGPLLQFINPARALPQESQINRSTMEIDPNMLSALLFDEEKAAEEVREIVENDSFHELLEKARKIREQRS
jgi:pSer/pThr/pTyr-binding forkhead associated (FHA) protein